MWSSKPTCGPDGYFLAPNTELNVVRRFLDELRFYALFIGAPYNECDVARSAERIWSRYFGSATIPEYFLNSHYKSLRGIAWGQSDSRSWIRDSRQVCYPWDPALRELVAIAMFRRWYRHRRSCPIPFEYPELVDAVLPPPNIRYLPRFAFVRRVGELVSYFTFHVLIS